MKERRHESTTTCGVSASVTTPAAITVDREVPQPQLASLRGIPGIVLIEPA